MPFFEVNPQTYHNKRPFSKSEAFQWLLCTLACDPYIGYRFDEKFITETTNDLVAPLLKGILAFYDISHTYGFTEAAGLFTNKEAIPMTILRTEPDGTSKTVSGFVLGVLGASVSPSPTFYGIARTYTDKQPEIGPIIIDPLTPGQAQWDS